MYRYLHFFCIVVLVSLISISWQIPQKIIGAPDWYAEHCWFSNWKYPVTVVDCATNVPVASYYSGKNVVGMREGDRDAFISLMKQRGCLIAGVDYYALTWLSPFYFPKLFEKYSDNLSKGSVIYLKICMKDSIFTYEIIGSSQNRKNR